jgi:methenyltetrahydromethanopterin cyclohydrolase
MWAMNLNEMAWRRCDELAAAAEKLGISVSKSAGGTRIIDCGVKAPGGLEAGRALAEISLAGLGQVSFSPGRTGDWIGPVIAVHTDQPVLACMCSEYAGWQVTGEKFFGMGSGPMRCVACREPLIEYLGYREKADRVVGVLETSKLPTDEICEKIASQCNVSADRLTLAVARTASIAGTLQVVARSVETALHKMHELGYDLHKVVSGFGSAPLPPIAADDLVAIGRTNDAILYCGEVTLWVRDDDERLADIVQHVPSLASRDYGEPFAKIYERAGRDFYKIDPLLFSPAVVMLVNLNSGRTHVFGAIRFDIVRESFFA